MTTVFKLSGLHCASCKGLIEDVARDVVGVQNAIVDSQASILTIEHDGGFNPEFVMEEIRGLGAGYTIAPV